VRRRYRTGDQTIVREMNISTALRILQEEGPLSRARLADRTGLNKTTVSSLAEELLALGLIHEIGRDISSGGRPATLLNLNPQAGCIIGVELGVDFISVIATDFVGQIVWRRMEETDPSDSQDAIINRALQLVTQATASNMQSGTRLLGLGLALPGLVDVESGILLFSPNLQWRNVPLREIFQNHTGLPVFIDNDANAAAQGEHLFGVARQVQDFVFLIAGVGLGGGLILNGEVYRGAGGIAGEIGHTSLMMDWNHPCRCGNRGCWETFGNQYSLIERVRARLEVGRTSLIPKLMRDHKSSLTLNIIAEAADAGDTEAQEALAETGAAIGLGIANLINIFNPEMVVLGGAMSSAGQHLLPAINKVVEERALAEIRAQIRIVLSAFGPDASVKGAVALVVKATLYSPSSVAQLSEEVR